MLSFRETRLIFKFKEMLSIWCIYCCIIRILLQLANRVLERVLRSTVCCFINAVSTEARIAVCHREVIQWSLLTECFVFIFSSWMFCFNLLRCHCCKPVQLFPYYACAALSCRSHMGKEHEFHMRSAIYSGTGSLPRRLWHSHCVFRGEEGLREAMFILTTEFLLLVKRSFKRSRPTVEGEAKCL